MSQDNDKIKEDNITVKVPVSNSENDTVLKNEKSKEVKKTVPNDQNSLNNVVNNGRQELVSKPIPSSYPLIRENIISKATEFLTAPAVKSTPIERKINFLRNKGLTDQEIQESMNRALKFNQSQNFYDQTPPLGYYNLSNTSGVIQKPYESQSWFKQLFWPLSVAATVAYIGYQIYKRYIENWLFVKRKSPLENRIEEIESSVKKCLTLLEISQHTSEPINQFKDLDVVRAELKSIKSLLLNRSQFPPAPVSPSIPQWQLSKNTKLRAEKHNKVNGTDSQNVSQQTIINGTVDAYLPPSCITNVASSSTANDDQYKLSDSTPNTSNNQNSIKSNDVVNNDKDDTNYKDIEQ